LPELRLISPPDRPELLARIRSRLGHAVPGSRLIAEGLRGADSIIDFVAIDPSGAVVLVLVGDHDDDLELIGRGLAQRAWVGARLGDWAQLAPNLGLRADASVRVLLLCPAYGTESRTAIASLGRGVLAAGLYRCVQNGTSFEVLIEHIGIADDEQTALSAAHRSGRPTPARAAAAFRTGLTDEDLGLTPEEKREFD
jgi:hypothetical protein